MGRLKTQLDDVDPIRQYLALKTEVALRKKFNSIEQYYPDTGPLRRELYGKHIAFFYAGKTYRERCIVAANRIGKSELGSIEVTYHLTGKYPQWWKGRRFKKATNIWAVGDTTQTVRDIAQAKLLGPPGEHGTGMIPNDLIVDIKKKSGSVPDAIESIKVKHKSGGISTVTFKSYDQKRKAFQGTHMDVIWLDEECPEDVYGECYMRTADTGEGNGPGMVMLTFTPLSGLTEIVLKFLPGGKLPEEEKSKFVIMASWDDVPHLSEDEKLELLAATPPHLRNARSKGVPQLGSGAIYPIEEREFVIDPFKIPEHWPKAYGMDVGWNRTAVLWGALDREADCWYLYNEYYKGMAEPAVHTSAIKARGKWMEGVIDPAARGRNQIDGKKLLDEYTKEGLILTPADNAVETGLFACYKRMTEGRLKYFSTLRNALDEVRIYRRDDKGKVVKANDHLMDAKRYLMMSGADVAKLEIQVTASWRDRLNKKAKGRGFMAS